MRSGEKKLMNECMKKKLSTQTSKEEGNRSLLSKPPRRTYNTPPRVQRRRRSLLSPQIGNGIDIHGVEASTHSPFSLSISAPLPPRNGPIRTRHWPYLSAFKVLVSPSAFCLFVGTYSIAIVPSLMAFWTNWNRTLICLVRLFHPVFLTNAIAPWLLTQMGIGLGSVPWISYTWGPIHVASWVAVDAAIYSVS